MFFSKSSHKTTANPKNIAILGTSAIGLYLANIFQSIGHHVSLLCPPQTADEFNATDFVFKETSSIKNPRERFSFSHELPFTPHVLFMASLPEHQNSDLSLLSPSSLTETLIVNINSFDGSRELSETIQKPIINAYTSSYLNRVQNHINIHGAKPKFNFSLADTSSEATSLREIFELTNINNTYFEDDTINFWNFIAPLTAFQLLKSSFEQSIPELSKTEKGRQTIDTLLEEISALALQSNAFISSTTLLNKIYEIPTGWSSPLQNSLKKKKPIYFNKFNNFLLNASAQNDKKYPLLYSLMHNLCNKY